MSSPISARALPIVLLALLTVLARPTLAEIDATAAMREGNALVRSGLYRAAVLRYREAQAAGLDTALLHYNLGVAYYRLERHEEAAAAFERAAEDPALAALASYNLGLVQRAAGRPLEAQSSFERAATGARGRGFATLAQQGSAARQAEATAGRAGAQPAPLRVRRDGPAGELHLSVTAGYGYADNIYRAPETPYVDVARPGQPLVEPELVAASYYPVDLDVRYVLHNQARDTDFVFGYLLDAQYHEHGFGNADRVTQRLEVGADMLLGERERRRRELQTLFFMVKHYEMNFDQEDGFDREIDDEDISRRFVYLSAGLESDFRHTLGRWRWGFDMRIERRDYEEAPLLPQYDHELYFGRVTTEFALNDATSLGVSVRRYRRLYEERPARDLDGALLSTNPALVYDYTGYQAAFTRRIARAVQIELGYARLVRADGFMGYQDYTRDTLRLGFDLQPNGRFSLSLAAAASSYDFPNAFAFNDPASGPRELDTIGGELRAEFLIRPTLSVWGELELREVTSTDPRAEYARSSTMLGVRWQR